jgi:LmbE family N-acetylglucosaminyl deacetylase
MNAREYLHAAERLPFADLDSVTETRSILVVAPHPDDESLGCGGLIAKARKRGCEVNVVILSDGTGSHPNSKRFPADALRALREQEAQAAAAALHVPQPALTFLRLRDQFVPREGGDAQAVAARITTIARNSGADAMFVTWAHDPHGDHQAAHAIAQLAAQHLPGCMLYSYPVWGWSLPPDNPVGRSPPRGFRLDIAAELPAKRRAIAAHRSQTTPLIDDDPHGHHLPAEMLKRFDRPFEIFLESDP